MKLRELIQRLSLQRQEDFPFPDNLESYLDDFVPNILLKSATYQQAFGVSNYEMEEIYVEAYNYYQDERYQDSLLQFRWLVILNPYSAKYWMGLAANQHLMQHYTQALHSYAMAALLDCENPYPHYHAFECYLALQNKEDAEKALLLAHQRTQNREQWESLKKEFEELLNTHFTKEVRHVV